MNPAPLQGRSGTVEASRSNSSRKDRADNLRGEGRRRARDGSGLLRRRHRLPLRLGVSGAGVLYVPAARLHAAEGRDVRPRGLKPRRRAPRKEAVMSRGAVWSSTALNSSTKLASGSG